MLVKIIISMWQSSLSVSPPWPGIKFAKSLIFKPLLRPEAKKPPNGAMRHANRVMIHRCTLNSLNVISPTIADNNGMNIGRTTKTDGKLQLSYLKGTKYTCSCGHNKYFGWKMYTS